MRLLISLTAVGFLALRAHAAIQSYCPSSSDGICYSVSIPEETVSSGTGDIFLQVSAPSSYEWVGLGYGSQMDGAYIWITYADGNGNVTVSPRTGTGHVEPEYNSNAQVTLLEGSGISDGKMTANFKCSGSGCGTTIDVSSASSNWIAAWKSGSALDSSSLTEQITQHDAHVQFTYDLTTAEESNDVNPFVSSSTSTSGSDSGSSSNSTSSSTSGASEVQTTNPRNFMIAHGVIMGTTVALLLPLGAILIRVAGVWIHLGLQVFCLLALWAGFGVGVKLAKTTNLLFNNTHTKFGTVLVCLFMLQPLLGVIHHRRYVATQSRGVFSHAHIWLGRILILLAIINGGLGLKLANNTTGGTVAYSVVAGIAVLAWGVSSVFLAGRKDKEPRKSSKTEKRLEASGSRESSQLME